nr:MAG TPA: hypothetical protein [Caudoviricetes sp.]
MRKPEGYPYICAYPKYRGALWLILLNQAI